MVLLSFVYSHIFQLRIHGRGRHIVLVIAKLDITGNLSIILLAWILPWCSKILKPGPKQNLQYWHCLPENL